MYTIIDFTSSAVVCTPSREQHIFHDNGDKYLVIMTLTIMIMVMVMMGYTENDNETICCRILIMIMQMTSICLCSANGNERNVMTPTVVTVVVDHLAIWQYHIWPRQTWLCTFSMSGCVCSW